MTLRSAASFLFLCLATTVFAAPAPPENFTIDTPTAVPGATLQPGSYAIRLVNHLTDRDIVEINSVTGDVHTTFIGLPNNRISKPSSAKAIDWSNPADGKTYVRGWYFPHSTAVTEFVYPKADAVAIAKANQAKVPAIDPASEGRVSDPALSPDDMRLITLWLLSSTSVGPSDASGGIKAERYEQAANTPPQRPVVKQLPHTAGFLPVLWLASLASLLVAALLRVRRYGQSAAAATRPAYVYKQVK